MPITSSFTKYYTGMCAHMLDQAFGSALKLHEPETIITFEDHLSYVCSPVRQPRLGQRRAGLVGCAHRAFASRHGDWSSTDTCSS